MTPGTYYETEEQVYYVFYEDGESGMIFTNGISMWAWDSRPDNNTPFTYTIDEHGNMVFYADGGEYKARIGENEEGFLRIAWENSYPSTLLLYSEIPYTQEEHYENERLRPLMLEYYQATTGENHDISYGMCMNDGNVSYSAINSAMWYSINPFTLKGTDCFGNEIDLNQIPSLPETAIPLETLREWAANDYSQKNNTEFFTISAAIIAPDKVMIEIDDDNYSVTIYTIDPETGIGTDADGAEINLPQTGNNDVRTIAVCAAAMILMLAGAAAIARVRRETTEQ